MGRRMAGRSNARADCGGVMDKLLHTETSLIITLGFSIIHPIVGVLVGVFLGIGKEVYNWFKYGKNMGWSNFKSLAISDLIADGIGIIFGIILFFGVRYGIH